VAHEIRRQANELDSKANTRAIDSLLNYETVKYFNNEEYEARRYDENLQKYESAAVKNEASLGLLNIGQSCIIAVAVTLLMILAAEGVVAKTLTLGDLVLVNGLLIQLYIPLNFLGMVYREIKQALAEWTGMFRLLTQDREIQDQPDAVPLPLGKGAGSAPCVFECVDFSYEPRRQILFDVSFEIPAGSKVAVVGRERLGKSTLARLLFRFYDVNAGRIAVNGTDIRGVTQSSLRAAIGIVRRTRCCSTTRFSNNIHYRPPDASPGGSDRRGEGGAHPRFHREPSRPLRIPGRRARTEAFRGRKAAGRDRPRHPERPEHPNLRRGHLRSRFGNRARHPGRARPHRPGAHHASHRSPSFHGHGRGSDYRSGSRPYPGAGPHRELLAQDGAYAQIVGAAAAGGGRGGRSLSRRTRPPRTTSCSRSRVKCHVYPVIFVAN